MTTRRRGRNPKHDWGQAYSLKHNYDRCAVLEKMRRLSHRTIFQLAEAGRRFVSCSRRIPKRLHAQWYFFSRSCRKGVMKDVVQVEVKRGVKHLSVERIVLCTEMRVARTPRHYWIRQSIHAQAGYSPAIHVDEFLSGYNEQLFAADIEQSLPKLVTVHTPN
jgi:hypothetical protein